MATYYTSSAASGGGDGSSGDPFTLAECDNSAGNVSAGDMVWVKGDGTYTLAADMTLPVGTNAAPVVFETYTTTPGDGGAAAIDQGDYRITWSVFSYWFGGNFSANKTSGNLIWDFPDYSGLSYAELAATYSSLPTSIVMDNATLLGVKITTSGSDPINKIINGDQGTRLIRCRITTPQNLLVSAGHITDCIFNQANVAIMSGLGCEAVFRRNVVYDNEAGVDLVLGINPGMYSVEDNIIYTSGGYGLDYSPGSYAVAAAIKNNAIGNCTSGRTNIGTLTERDAITLTGDPFVDAANGDFRLNDVPGAGRACRHASLRAPSA